MQIAVRAATSLSCSLGVSTAKVVCKVASDRRKPGGITVVPPGAEARFLAPYPSVPAGVGPRAEERLRAAGVETVGGLAALSDLSCAPCCPTTSGRLLRDRARGIDDRDLELGGEQISISVEETFERDLADRERLHAELRRMAPRSGAACVGKGLAGANGHDQAPLRRLLDPVAARRPSPPRSTTTDDRRARVRAARPRAARPAGRAEAVGVGVSGLSDHRQLSFDGAA